MSNPETGHNRTQFQIDRIAFFSDAVIAIAITLTVLEIKLPELGKNASLSQIMEQHGQSIVLHTLALLIGFVTIGNLWMRHHELFEHIHNYNKRLVRINLYFLLTIMILPITISFLFTPNEPAQMQQLLYFLNLFLCGLIYMVMLLVIFHEKNNFSSLTDKKVINKIKLSSLIYLTVQLLAVILILFRSGWFYMPFVLLPVVRLFRKRASRKSTLKAQL